jgi:hypothetical protein
MKVEVMLMKEPMSMDELIFFTNRSLGKGSIRAWAFRPLCPKCKTSMGKPINEKGKVAIRAEEYACPSCKLRQSKEEAESSLALQISYTCPSCGKKGETTTPYKRKTWQGVPAFVFTCTACKEIIGITKKMKEPKKKGAPAVDDDI